MNVALHMRRDAGAAGEWGRVHVVGAGLAGLAAALSLTEAGRPVVLHEAGPQAGGRCRSYFDRALGCRIDNGNHLLLSGNRDTFAFLDQVGSRGTMAGPGAPVFPFIDLAGGERWTLRPNRGPVPWWLLVPGRRVPGMRLRDMLPALRLARAPAAATVADVLRPGVLYRRLLEPLAVAALNTSATEGSARLLGAVVAETLAAGGGACVPAFPREGLSESFIDPAVAWLRARGTEVRLSSRVPGLTAEGGRVTALGAERLRPGDSVVLAVPAPVAAGLLDGLLPALTVPDRFEAILNVHYRLDWDAATDPGGAGFMGIVGGTAEWVFLKPGVVSVTISAANKAVDAAPDALAQQVWHDLRVALHVPEPVPAYRVVKEKRATFAATPEQEAKRPAAATALTNLVLAGDWTATGLPATIEGAIRSGRAAARILAATSRDTPR